MYEYQWIRNGMEVTGCKPP